MFDNLGFDFSCRDFKVVKMNDYRNSSLLILSCDFLHQDGLVTFVDVCEIIPSDIDESIGKKIAYINHEANDIYKVCFSDDESEITVKAQKVLIQGPYDEM